MSKLQRFGERYRGLFENVGDAIWVHDLEGNFIVANRAAEKLTGYSVRELTELNVRNLLSDEGFNLARQIQHKLLTYEPVNQPYEQRLIRKDGTNTFIQVSSSLIFEGSKSIAFQHIARDVTEQSRGQENQRLYLQHVTRAWEEERKRVARELHDRIVQALVVLSRRLEALTSGGEGLTEGNRLYLDKLRQQTNNIMQGVCRLSQDLRPALLDHLGLVSALEWLASSAADCLAIATKVNMRGTQRRLPEEAELMLFRIAQEGLRNVWRHSEATKAEVIVQFDKSKTRITISDNGKGFDVPDNLGDLAKDGKMGLAGMQEHAQLAGASLVVQSAPGKGSTVTIELPV